ncbi:hypothetical protein BDV96DRAFT_486623 [Lophiotrema nucula]|uniref:DUF7702 domain-containing protein n=1 Tax=Lophiotrema nucula TaxID=690887 RepID=A0A6A5ZMF7_9PLEO|nr:hypothetical protein BDV96DRAFT_486623 [Lophiotrema nucula]
MGNGDGRIYYRDAIAIAQVVLFSLSFFCAVFFRWTRRFWFTIFAFSTIRYVGAGCMLGTVNKDSDGLWAGVFVCESLGVLLLIFTVLEILGHVDKMAKIVDRRVFWVPQLLTYIDIGISIAGFIVVSKKNDDQLLPTPYSKAGIAILVAIYAYTAGVVVYFWFQRQRVDAEDHQLLLCTIICAPMLFVRVLYSLIFVATANMTWNAVKGNPTAYLTLTVLPEVAFIGVSCLFIAKSRPLMYLSATEDLERKGTEEQLSDDLLEPTR